MNPVSRVAFGQVMMLPVPEFMTSKMNPSQSFQVQVTGEDFVTFKSLLPPDAKDDEKQEGVLTVEQQQWPGGKFVLNRTEETDLSRLQKLSQLAIASQSEPFMNLMATKSLQALTQAMGPQQILNVLSTKLGQLANHAQQ